MSRNLNSAVSFLKKEIARQESIVLTETLKESVAKMTRESAEKRIEQLKEQITQLGYE